MDERTDRGSTPGDVVTDLAALLAGLAMITMVLFPFALPMLVLVGVALVPLLVLGLLAGVVAAVVAAPIVVVRRLRRRSDARPAGAVQRERAAMGLRVAPPAGAAKS